MKKVVLLIVAGLVFLVTVNSVEAARRSFGSSYKMPSYKTPSTRNYSTGGSLYYQRGYVKGNGAYVQPHLKTKPDNTVYNNRKYRLGY